MEGESEKGELETKNEKKKKKILFCAERRCATKLIFVSESRCFQLAAKAGIHYSNVGESSLRLFVNDLQMKPGGASDVEI